MCIRSIVSGGTDLPRLSVSKADDRNRWKCRLICSLSSPESRGDPVVFHGYRGLRTSVFPHGLLQRQHLDGHGGPYGVELPPEHCPRAAQQRKSHALCDL